MDYEVLGNRVMVEPQEKAEMSAGGVHLPESMKENTIKGLVVSVGYGRYTETGELIQPVAGVGDVVWFSRSTNKTEVVLDGKTYLIIRDEDVLLRVPAPGKRAKKEPEKVEYK